MTERERREGERVDCHSSGSSHGRGQASEFKYNYARCEGKRAKGHPKTYDKRITRERTREVLMGPYTVTYVSGSDMVPSKGQLARYRARHA